MNLLISETGKVRGFIEIESPGVPPVFTSGSVSVSNGDAINGEMRGQDLLSLPPLNLPPGSAIILPIPTMVSCGIFGTVVEQASLTVQIACSDDIALVCDETVTLTLQPGYLQGSSLQSIAGNYSLAVKPGTNMLNITEDGTVFGMYDNGPSCTINGLVSIIDERFSLLDVEWTFSSCTDFFGQSEGAEYSGFAMPSPDPGMPDSYYFLLTRETPEALSLISVLYDPT